MHIMTETHPSRYSEAGVDIDKGNAFVKGIKEIVASTHQTGVLNDIGGFSAHYAIDLNKYRQPVLVTSTDGVGTKLAIAHLCNKHDTIGIDLVAMCVNDIIVGGATPLCFLDYFAIGRLDVAMATEVVKGIAEGCRQAKCSLVGGETAEMPGLYRGNDYDLAGFVTGIVNRDAIIDGSDIRVGNTIIGLASSGLHSNGYSLARKIVTERLGDNLDAILPELGQPLGEVLLRPTRIYVKPILNLLRDFQIQGMAHITGGGLLENIPRMLPRHGRARIRTASWPKPAIFEVLRAAGKLEDDEFYRTFNCGIGLVLVVPKASAGEIIDRLRGMHEEAFLIGEIVEREDDESPIELV